MKNKLSTWVLSIVALAFVFAGFRNEPTEIKLHKITVTDLPPLSSVEKIRVIDQAGLTAIFETTSDILVVVDRATTIAAGTLPFPVVPVDGQLMMVSTRVQITALTLDTGPSAIPISGSISTLAAGGAAGWCYDLVSNRWFRLP